MEKLAIIIPTFNEKENIYLLTFAILKLLPKCTIYIIDDTKQKNYFLKFNNKRIKYFLRKNKSGRGSAVLFGFKKALQAKKFNVFIEMDADFSHNPKELKKNLFYFKKKKLDLLISSRYLAKSKIINWTVFRRILSFLSNKLANFLLQINVSDYTNGFRIYSSRSIKLITKKCGNIGDGFIVLSEILLIIKSNGYKISEVPSVFVNRKRGESSVNLSLVFKSLIGLFRLFFIKLN
jgi:dolichol-phosphate mannosyltransferase